MKSRGKRNASQPNVVGAEINAANNLDDPLDLAEDYKLFLTKTGEEVILRHYKAVNLPAFLSGWALDLMHENMSNLYQKCSWGWSRRGKKREMMEENARYLVAFLKDKPIGFTHFRFDMDFERQVIYCYEIQLDSAFRALRLGSHIMRTLEALALRTKIPLIVLTTLKNNPSATKFFENLGYKPDETNLGEELDYLIMSKKVH